MDMDFSCVPKYSNVLNWNRGARNVQGHVLAVYLAMIIFFSIILIHIRTPLGGSWEGPCAPVGPERSPRADTRTGLHTAPRHQGGGEVSSKGLQGQGLSPDGFSQNGEITFLKSL